MRQSHKVRFDEEREPVESGCIYHDNCFTCPWPECLLNVPKLKVDAVVTAAKIRKLAAEGCSKKEIARKLDKSIRTIDRHLKQAR